MAFMAFGAAGAAAALAFFIAFITFIAFMAGATGTGMAAMPDEDEPDDMVKNEKVNLRNVDLNAWAKIATDVCECTWACGTDINAPAF